MEICLYLQSGQRGWDSPERVGQPQAGTQAVRSSHTLRKKKETFRKLNVRPFFHVLNLTTKMKADPVVWKPLSNLLEPMRKS